MLSTKKRRSISDEKTESGKVKCSIYKDYFKAMNFAMDMDYKFPLLFAIVVLTSSVLQMARNIWLSAWSDENTMGVNHKNMMSVGERLGVYAGIGLSETLVMSTAVFLLVLGAVNASINMHAPLLHSLLRARLSFFGMTPIGRILNRFGKDIEVLDVRLQNNFYFFTICALNVLQTLAVIMLSTPLFDVVVIPIAVIYILILRYFIDTSRQLQRLASVTRSPIYSPSCNRYQQHQSSFRFTRMLNTTVEN